MVGEGKWLQFPRGFSFSYPLVFYSDYKLGSSYALRKRTSSATKELRIGGFAAPWHPLPASIFVAQR